MNETDREIRYSHESDAHKFGNGLAEHGSKAERRRFEAPRHRQVCDTKEAALEPRSARVIDRETGAPMTGRRIAFCDTNPDRQ